MKIIPDKRTGASLRSERIVGETSPLALIDRVLSEIAWFRQLAQYDRAMQDNIPKPRLF